MTDKDKFEEPVSEDLEEAIEDAMPDANWYIEENNDTTGEDAYNSIQMGNMFKAGAKWQKQQEYTCYEEAFEDGAKWKAEQFEQERLKHCDELTEAQAQIKSDFVTQHLKENNRTPTFIDAIEYGMQFMKEQMMKDAHECEVKVDAGGYPYIPQIELYDYEKNEPLAEEGDKYKVILIKKD